MKEQELTPGCDDARRRTRMIRKDAGEAVDMWDVKSTERREQTEAGTQTVRSRHEASEAAY